jgi:stage V sporulation protein G
LRARYCNNCGKHLVGDQVSTDGQGRAKLYADIAHPINSQCREQIQNCVIGEFEKELERATQPGYMSRYDDDYEDRPRRRETPPTETRPPASADPPESLRGPHSPEKTSRAETRPPDSGKPQPGGPRASAINESENGTGNPSGHNPDFGSGIY